MSSEKELVELARIIGKAEAGKKLTAKEACILLPYLIIRDIGDIMKEYKETGKIKPRRRLRL